jgi:hypothetical protein
MRISSKWQETSASTGQKATRAPVQRALANPAEHLFCRRALQKSWSCRNQRSAAIRVRRLRRARILANDFRSG